MNMFKFLLKGQRRVIIFELIVLITFFLSSSFSYGYYLKTYRTEWNNLLEVQTEPDLEIQISQSIENYLMKRDELLEKIENFQYYSISILPSHLFELKVDNESNELFNLYILNSMILEKLNFSLSGNQVLIGTDQFTNVNLSTIQANFTILSEYSNTNIIGHLNETTLYSTIFGISSGNIAESSENISLVISESYFSTLLSSIDTEILLNITDNNLTYAYYVFSLDKTNLMDSSPKSLNKVCREWGLERITVFFQLYYQQINQFASFGLDIKPVLFDKLNDLSSRMNVILLNSTVVLFFLFFIIIQVFHQMLKNNISAFNKIISIFSSRGLKKRQARIQSFLIHTLVLVLADIVSLGFTFLFLYYFELSMWSFSYTVILISNSSLFVINLILQISLVQQINQNTKQEVDKKTKNKSRSNTLDKSIKIGIGVLFLIIVLTILSFNLKFLNLSNISISSLWIIFVSLGGLIIFIMIIPFIIQNFILQLIQHLLKYISLIYTFSKKLFSSLNRQKYQIWRIIFILQVSWFLMISSYTTLIVYQEQSKASAYCYNVSIMIETSAVSDVKFLTKDCLSLTSYIEPKYETPTEVSAIFIYLESPTSFFNGTNFSENYFKKMSNFQVFSKLNLSEEYFITTRQEAKMMGYDIDDIVSLYKNDLNGTRIEERKILLDIADFVPFFSIIFDSDNTKLYLMNYNSSSHIIGLDNYAIHSFLAKNEHEAEQIFVSIREKQHIFKTIHSFSYSDIEDKVTHNFLLPESELPIYFLSLLIPGILIIMLINIRREGYYLFSFLYNKGLKISTIRNNFFLWFFMQLTSITLISYIYSIIAQQSIIYILNLLFTVPIHFVFSWVQLGLFLIILSSVLMFILPYNWNKTKKYIIQKNKGI